MNPDHQEEAQQLLEVRPCDRLFVLPLHGHVSQTDKGCEQFRQRALYMQSNQSGDTSWSNGQSSGPSAAPDATLYSQAYVPPVQDPLIYTDLYAPSGIDMISILVCHPPSSLQQARSVSLILFYIVGHFRHLESSVGLSDLMSNLRQWCYAISYLSRRALLM
jgi:hypothetical protein